MKGTDGLHGRRPFGVKELLDDAGRLFCRGVTGVPDLAVARHAADGKVRRVGEQGGEADAEEGEPFACARACRRAPSPERSEGRGVRRRAGDAKEVVKAERYGRMMADIVSGWCKICGVRRAVNDDRQCREMVVR